MENVGKVTIAGIVFLVLMLITTWAHVFHLDETCTDVGTTQVCQDGGGNVISGP